MHRTKALLIGISYRTPNANQSSRQWDELDGTLGDVKHMSTFLKEELKYGDVTVITDERDPMKVSRNSIRWQLDRLRWLVRDAKAGDVLFLHYSGHGWQRPTRSNTEIDHLDEAIIPAGCPYPAPKIMTEEPRQDDCPECGLDCQCAPGDPACWKASYQGMIRDNELREILQVPKGAHLVALFDCCHSGSILDLHYQYLPRGAPRAKPATRRTLSIDYNQRFKPTINGIREFLDNLGQVSWDSLPVRKLKELLDPDEPRSIKEHLFASSAQLGFDIAQPRASAWALSRPEEPAMEIHARMVEDHLRTVRSGRRGVVLSISACADPDVVFERYDGRGLLTSSFVDIVRKQEYNVKADTLLDEMCRQFVIMNRLRGKHAVPPIYPVLCSNGLVDMSAPFQL